MSATSKDVFGKLFYEICSKRYCMGLAEYKNYIKTIGNIMGVDNTVDTNIGKWSLALVKNDTSKNDDYCPIEPYTKIKKHEKKIILENFEKDWKDYNLIVKMNKAIENTKEKEKFNLIFKGGEYFLQKASENNNNGFTIIKIDTENASETEHKYSFSVIDYFKSHIDEVGN